MDHTQKLRNMVDALIEGNIDSAKTIFAKYTADKSPKIMVEAMESNARQLARYSDPIEKAPAKLKALIMKDHRIIAFNIEDDGVFIYTDSNEWSDDAGAGTFSGHNVSTAIKNYQTRVQRAEPIVDEEEFEVSLGNDRRVMEALDHGEYHVAPVEKLKKGEFVKRKPESNKVFILGDYDRETKRFSLEDADDMNREVFVKAGTQLVYGFTY